MRPVCVELDIAVLAASMHTSASIRCEWRGTPVIEGFNDFETD
jgi:hypothetical protein